MSTTEPGRETLAAGSQYAIKRFTSLRGTAGSIVGTLNSVTGNHGFLAVPRHEP